MGNLGECRVDFISTHIYSCSADYTMQVLQDLYSAYGRKIWLTEFACPMTSDPNVIRQYMQEVIPRLEAADFVDRYAWFASGFATQVEILINVFFFELLTIFFRIGDQTG